jgi:3-oxoacyl-[acyl-carrier protein] reductase
MNEFLRHQNFDNSQQFDNSTQPAYFILGATGGIGSALCRRLAARRAQLVIGARNEARLQQLATETGAHAIALDASQPEQVAEFFARGFEYTRRIDGAVNCVGSLLLKSAHLTNNEEWEAVIASNLTPAFFTVREATRLMTKHGGGSIVLVSSCAANIGLPNHEGIAAAKAGVNGLVISAAATYSRYKIRVNAVAPGLVRTPLTEKLVNNESALQASTALHPLGRIGEPDDVAATIEFLLDPRNSWMTGQILNVDGGLSTLKTR